jgi:hypothetical protein
VAIALLCTSFAALLITAPRAEADSWIDCDAGQNLQHLLAGSPAIDAIPGSACPFAHDQRGQARPAGAGCDIGAYEVHPGH